MAPNEKPVYVDDGELRKYGRVLKNLAFEIDTAHGFSNAINLTPGEFEWGKILQQHFKLRIEGGQDAQGLRGSLRAYSGILSKTGDEMVDLADRYYETEDKNKGDSARLWDLINGIAEYDANVKNVMPPDAGGPPGPPGVAPA